MKNVLYIGNKLESKTSNLSAIHILGSLLEKEGFHLCYASSKSNKALRLWDMVFTCIYTSRKTDVVLIDVYSTLNFYYAFIISQLCRILRLQYIPILHGGNLQSRLVSNPKLSALIFNNSKINVAPSEFIKSTFENFGFLNIISIPNSIEIHRYKFKNRPIEKINLLWVRSFSKLYNPQLAIKILKSLKDKGFDTELCMVGPDSDGSLALVKQLAKNLNVNVRFTGKLSKKEWLELAKDYNIFINTTNFDNMPVSVIEAMALGLPIVSTNVGGMSYLISNGNDGLLVEPNDEVKFVTAIKKLVDQPTETEQMVVNARKKVEQFDWEVIKHSWIKIIKN